MQLIGKKVFEEDFFISKDLDLAGFCRHAEKMGDRFARCRGEVSDVLVGDV